MPIEVTSYTVEKNNISALSKAWLELESIAKPSTFLSWAWIETLISSTEQEITVTEATLQGKTVGIGLWFSSYSMLRKSKKLSLHKTGISKLDQVWIEYNDFLLEPSHETKVRKVLASFVLHQLQWDTLDIGPAQSSVIALFEKTSFENRISWSAPSFAAELSEYDSIDNYLLSLSKNIRGQVRRDLSIASSDLEIEVATSTEECRQWFADSATAHIKRWRDTTTGSGFGNAAFVQFHEKLIEKGFSNGSVCFLKFRHQQTTLAHFYYFIDKKNIRFYLSSIDYDVDTPYKNLGLLLHAKAIEYFLPRGALRYDFMGGNAQYKRSLSHIENRLETISVYKSSFDSILRHCKTFLVNAFFSQRKVNALTNGHVELVIQEKGRTQGLQLLPNSKWKDDYREIQALNNCELVSSKLSNNFYLSPSKLLFSVNDTGMCCKVTDGVIPEPLLEAANFNQISTKSGVWQLDSYSRQLSNISGATRTKRELGRITFGGYCLADKIYLFSECGKVTLLSKSKLFTLNEVYLHKIFGFSKLTCHNIWPMSDERILCIFSSGLSKESKRIRYHIASVDLKTDTFEALGNISLTAEAKIVGVFFINSGTILKT